jgi:hypothetical protein
LFVNDDNQQVTMCVTNLGIFLFLVMAQLGRAYGTRPVFGIIMPSVEWPCWSTFNHELATDTE